VVTKGFRERVVKPATELLCRFFLVVILSTRESMKRRAGGGFNSNSQIAAEENVDLTEADYI
jgi:hypothetical protein